MTYLHSQASVNNDESQYVLEASVDNTRNLSLLLKAIHFRDVATVCATSDGLKVTVEDTKSVQGNVYIQASLFHEYVIKEQTVVFKVNLSVLLECLNVFGNKNNPNFITTVKICYGGYGSPLVLLLEENGALTDCKLQTMEPDDILDFEFTPSKVVNKVIMQSEILKEAWADLDMNSEFLEILLSPEEPYFQLTTKGTLATIHINFTKDSDMIESFECTTTLRNRYQILLIKRSLRALIQSQKVSIRTDDRGFLCMQYMIKVEGSQCCFVEYLCSPSISEEDT
ncbi:cell cycle checkpoint protein RAD1-like [Uloborus diversus]|uniref:cell cycle checkpoint protein RAD1-like n=1 Tax=Uloborus diversus TaxID=327109 RepID=UPI002409F6F7|nr:cell cycle checkpoint protein RAD1-like [Uloborus diversus]